MPLRVFPSCTTLTEPWIVEPASMAPRTNTLPQPAESRNNERSRTGERRRFTNHLAIKVYLQLSFSSVARKTSGFEARSRRRFWSVSDVLLVDGNNGDEA